MDLAERCHLDLTPKIRKRPANALTRKQISHRFSTSVGVRLAENKSVRRALPVWGRVHVEHQVPFLVVYRRPIDRDDSGSERLVRGEASYMTAAGERWLYPSLAALTKSIANTLARSFGGFLLIEIWTSSGEPHRRRPARVYATVSYR